jgi:rubrerythrin
MASSEQAKIISALETSIRMEIDGKAFYLKASTDSTNAAGKKLLSQLAAEEDTHLALFEMIYETMRREKSWPDIEVKPSASRKTLFSVDASRATSTRPVLASEIEAVNTALGMETKSYDFYQTQMKTAGLSSETRFYRAVAEQERKHQLVLLDYLEFLQDPSAYFTRTEHHSLDGG